MSLTNEAKVAPAQHVIDGLDEWRTLPIKQQPPWLDHSAVVDASEKLASFPPLVFAGEVDTLRERLAVAASGRAFLLQGGDCAETFVFSCSEPRVWRRSFVLYFALS